MKATGGWEGVREWRSPIAAPAASIPRFWPNTVIRWLHRKHGPAGVNDRDGWLRPLRPATGWTSSRSITKEEPAKSGPPPARTPDAPHREQLLKRDGIQQLRVWRRPSQSLI